MSVLHCWQSHWNIFSFMFFTDESRFKFQDGRARVRRRQGERHIDVCVLGTDGNVGPSVIVWARLHYGGKSELIVVDGTMNRQVYRLLQQQSLLCWTKANFQKNFVLVYDNAPPRTAQATRDFLENQDTKVMDWLAKSPDMNPIKHLWDQKVVHIHDVDNPLIMAAQFHMAVQQDRVVLRAFIRSMPCRVRVVLPAYGGHTHY